MIKIAIPTRDEQVDDHFGHCDHYTLFTIDDQKQIIEKEYLASPEGCGCKSNIASILEKKVSLLCSPEIWVKEQKTCLIHII